jgi:kanamycin kinase
VRAVEPPAALRDRYAGWSWSPAWTYEGAVTTWRLSTEGGEALFLKVRAVEEAPTLAEEARRLEWARAHLPVPAVLGCGSDGDADWLLLEGLPGRDATAPELRARPGLTVPALARGLRRFHETPVHACPFRFTFDGALATVRRRVAEGRATHDDLHPEFSHLSIEDAVSLLVELKPADEDLVVCHGDYCFPNVLVEGDEVTAYLDLGELAVADRWWDLAVASWSTTWNVGTGYQQLFLDSYGIDPDPRRITFFRLLYDLVS